jgi:hypothetical protein
MVDNLLASVLTVLVSFLVRWFFAAIGVEIDEALFNTIVAGIVLWFLSLLGADVAKAGLRKVNLIK